MYDYLAWDKIAQTLTAILAADSRRTGSADPRCAGHGVRRLSIAGQQTAPADRPTATMRWRVSADCARNAAPSMTRFIQRWLARCKFRDRTPAASSSRNCSPPQAGAQLLRHTRYLLTLKGRPPFRPAGIRTYARLQGVVALSQELLAQRPDLRLANLCKGLQTALTHWTPAYDEPQPGAAWLHDIDHILAAPELTTAGQVAQRLRGYLDQCCALPDLTPRLLTFRNHLARVTASDWPGVFHCDDMPAPPRTDNGLESYFRDTQRHLLRSTGQKRPRRRTLQYLGAWELLPRPPTEAAGPAALCRAPRAQLTQEQASLRQHQGRSRLQTRLIRHANAQFDKLPARWHMLATSAARQLLLHCKTCHSCTQRVVCSGRSLPRRRAPQEPGYTVWRRLSSIFGEPLSSRRGKEG